MATFDIISSNPIISGFIVAIGSGVILGYLRRRQQQKKEARAWYGEAAGFISNLQQAARKATIYRDSMNYDSLHENLDGLDEEMMRHANKSHKRVQEDSRVELAVLAAYTTGLASLTEKSSETDALDFIKRVQDQAIESYDGEYEMDDLESLFSGFDFEDIAEKVDNDVDINEQVAKRLRSRFSDESLEAGYPTTISEALSIPIEEARDAFETEGFLDTVVDDSLEMFVEMVTGMAEEIHGRMEQRQDRI